MSDLPISNSNHEEGIMGMSTSRVLRLGLVALAALSLGMGRKPPEKAETGAVESKAAAEAPKEVRESLKVIKGFSGKMDARTMEAANALEKDPEKATPGLVECFTDGHNSRESRMACADLLRKNPSWITAQQQEQFLAAARNEKESELLRIDAGLVLLAITPTSAEAARKEIKQMAFKLSKNGKYQDHLRMSVLSNFQNDPEVEKFLIDQMQAEPEQSNRDGILDNLGKRKCKALIPIIDKQLSSPNPEQVFSKVRMYWALGDVGGSKAANILIRELPRETDDGLQDTILRALGASRAAEAKPVLMDYLLNKPGGYRIAALDGLKYFGDASTIPFLEEYLTRKDLTDYERLFTKGAIEGIRQRNDAKGR